MPKTYMKFQFVPSDSTGYEMDMGNTIAASAGGYLPPDIPTTEITSILQAAGAQPLSAVRDNLPCTDSVNAELRKLIFIRDNGNSMSVPVGTRANLLQAATVIRGILNSGDAQVSCIKLVGEYFPNVADQLGLTYAGTFAQSHRPLTGGKQFVYSGSANYETDVVRTALGDDVVFQNVKVNTNVENAPPTKFGTTWTNCVGAFANALTCRGQGKTNPRKHRRYELTFATKSDLASATEVAQTETNELPVIGATAAEILACGTAATNLDGLYCIGYRGESYDRYHLILP